MRPGSKWLVCISVDILAPVHRSISLDFSGRPIIRFATRQKKRILSPSLAFLYFNTLSLNLIQIGWNIHERGPRYQSEIRSPRELAITHVRIPVWFVFVSHFYSFFVSFFVFISISFFFSSFLTV